VKFMGKKTHRTAKRASLSHVDKLAAEAIMAFQQAEESLEKKWPSEERRAHYLLVGLKALAEAVSTSHGEIMSKLNELQPKAKKEPRPKPAPEPVPEPVSLPVNPEDRETGS
jgi:hypothetical protein